MEEARWGAVSPKHVYASAQELGASASRLRAKLAHIPQGIYHLSLRGQGRADLGQGQALSLRGQGDI